MKTRSVLAILSICGLSLQSTRADDCNNNGVDDADDIYTNCTSLDLDDSGTPDECDIADGLMTDCNNNGIADWADIFGASDMCGNPVGGGSADCGAGRDAGNGIAGGDCYGSVTEPMELGSGGGDDVNVGGGNGGAGGGALNLTVGGVLTVDGLLSADGQINLAGEAGGGSGGSLLIDCETLAGSGTITARGGNVTSGGSGGGGRIAITYGTSTFTGAFNA
ncbi:MAG: hypothetical protein IT435_01785 [Phycisphaerales bacterium]|nr:hypothetical protein [Phycisphaerales bacterium]